MHVLDTNTVAYFFRGEGRVADRFLATLRSQIAIPSIVAYELRHGAERVPDAKRLAEQLRTLFTWVTILPFDAAAAQVAARIRVELERAGQPIGPHDVLIAATSLAVNGTIVTRNVTEFGRVKGLRVENWYE